MVTVDLAKIIHDAQTLEQVFNLFQLKGVEIMIHSDLGMSYIPIDARREFVILENNGDDRMQFLHPYGTSVAYSIHNTNPKKAL